MPADQSSDTSGTNDDLKAKMREALDKKNKANHPSDADAGLHEKAHGSEVQGSAAPKMHRRKAGGGGS